jgi:NADPH-dependent glutamate synthase beta subunit-like oxidoreductase/Pyruvate/2-oxoacid:ferredoxin oxidoreductase delta subunit
MNESRQNALYMPRSCFSTESNKTGSWRFLRPRYEEKTSPCSASCPVGEDIARIQMLTAQGLFKEAWEVILLENPLPGVCGRVCFHPCETVCNRIEFDSGIAIHTIERFLADTAARYDLKPVMESAPPRKEKIAIVGAGPAGLSAAWFLNQLGYSCDVFEASEEPGGILRWGIPQYRLPLTVLKSEIARIVKAGAASTIINTGVKAGADFLKNAKGKYDAVFVGAGYGRSTDLKIPGEDLAGVEDGLKFLAEIRRGGTPACDGISVVIGGGNTAIDVSRSIRRLGGEAVILYRRRRQDMPAFGAEIDMALEEGVQIRELLAPAGVRSAGKELEITMRHMKVAGVDGNRARVEPDGARTLKLRARRIFKATGAEPAEEWVNPPEKGRSVLALHNCVLVKDQRGPAVVFGGDLANETKSVTHAIASGKAAAMALDTMFRDGFKAVRPRLRECEVGDGHALSMEIYLGGPRKSRSRHIVGHGEINTDYFRFAPALSQPRLTRCERVSTFDEVDHKIAANLAMRESERCFNCGICNGCDNCYLFCPDMSVVRDGDIVARHINYDYCKGCGLCVVECPRNAMVLEEEKG